MSVSVIACEIFSLVVVTFPWKFLRRSIIPSKAGRPAHSFTSGLALAARHADYVHWKIWTRVGVKTLWSLGIITPNGVDFFLLFLSISNHINHQPVYSFAIFPFTKTKHFLHGQISIEHGMARMSCPNALAVKTGKAKPIVTSTLRVCTHIYTHTDRWQYIIYTVGHKLTGWPWAVIEISCAKCANR